MSSKKTKNAEKNKVYRSVEEAIKECFPRDSKSKAGRLEVERVGRRWYRVEKEDKSHS